MQPAQSEPIPREPAPSEPAPSEPAPSEPVPSEPVPILAGGIAGEVILRPVLPVERPGTVNQRPYQAVVTILDAAGRTVATVSSDANGRFEAVLAPGPYRLRPESEVAAPRAPEQAVSVAPGRVTSVRIIYDSGIR